jgi:hypothetical protein
MMTWRRVLIGLALIVSQIPSPSIAQVTSPILGEWVGSYSCIQGWTGLHLNIKAGSSGNLTATFSFGALPSNPRVPSGTFMMDGTFDSLLRHLTLRPTGWISQPEGFTAVGLDGTLDCPATHLQGTVTGGTFCSTFSLSRASTLPKKLGPCGAKPALVSSR